MKYTSLVILFLFSFQLLPAQELTGKELLEKAITYHDPNNNWSTFNGELFITMETPNNKNRESKIIINLPSEYFYVQAKRDSITTEYTLDKADCSIKLNGLEDISEENIKTYNLNCDRAHMYKNYYTYLYGLPMKLKDEGTVIQDKVERKTFKGKEYLVLSVSYDEGVGSDVWYFYFDPNTFAMEVYQFFKTDEKGELKPDSGEYILLTETKTVNEIKIPKNRAWYYNKDDKYLGTDVLKN
ncbi:DUF6503 family protein [Psychroserpens luteus]|uniref:DUF6503 family protein n=1 Tax=Psychroserpens luteus TaxID=1434066 RepID=A0ABW5ZQ47_9FLAO|nr:DUF6503 family protein [Psychroserpens luteus]